MKLRYGSALAAIILAAGLSACGGGSSDFKAKALAECQKSEEAKTQDCACAVDIMDKELDDKTKKFFLVMMDPEVQKDPAKMEAAMKDSGLTPEDMAAMGTKMGPIMEKVEKQCKKT